MLGEAIEKGVETIREGAQQLWENAKEAVTNFAKKKEKSKEEVDPNARPGQKRGQSEVKSKARRNKDFEPRNNRRRPKPPKSHTPGKDHRKGYEKQ